MTLFFNKKPLLKLSIQILFWSGLAILLVYGVVKMRHLNQKEMIDKTITYTTSTITTTIPLDLTPSPEEIVASIPEYVSVPEGGVDWKLFAKTQSIPYSFTNEKSEEHHGVKPKFTETIQELDGQTITMQGHMFPLSAEEKQSTFLFGPFPVSCPFHYHVGPALVMVAQGKEALALQWDPITIKGRLELVPQDDEYNVFYRLHDVVLKQ